MTPDPYDAWEPWTVGTEITGGPSRIYDNDADNETPPRPLLGFRRRVILGADQDPTELKLDETEPLLWEGDNA